MREQLNPAPPPAPRFDVSDIITKHRLSSEQKEQQQAQQRQADADIAAAIHKNQQVRFAALVAEYEKGVDDERAAAIEAELVALSDTLS